MADFDVSALKEMQEWAKFGKAVVEMAKNAGFVPKRQIVKTKTVERIKVVMRRPRRTKAEMLAAREMEALERDKSVADEVKEEKSDDTGGALDTLLK